MINPVGIGLPLTRVSEYLVRTPEPFVKGSNSQSFPSENDADSQQAPTLGSERVNQSDHAIKQSESGMNQEGMIAINSSIVTVRHVIMRQFSKGDRCRGCEKYGLCSSWAANYSTRSVTKCKNNNSNSNSSNSNALTLTIVSTLRPTPQKHRIASTFPCHSMFLFPDSPPSHLHLPCPLYTYSPRPLRVFACGDHNPESGQSVVSSARRCYRRIPTPPSTASPSTP